MLAHLNHTQPLHILTLEDPIEFVHPSQRSLVQQRKVPGHSADFATALRAALRQDPDVILVGELRDLPTIELALSAAETGHLVLATLHTRSATQAIERLVDVFLATQKPWFASNSACPCWAWCIRSCAKVWTVLAAWPPMKCFLQAPQCGK